MIRINLSPEAIAQYNTKETLVEIGVAAAIIFVAYAGPGVYAGLLNSEAEALNNETSQKSLALEELRADSEKINQFKVSISNLKVRTDRIRNLNRGRKQPVFALDRLQQQHPDRLWLESLALKDSEISLTGVASEPEIITDYVTRIRKLNESDIKTETDVEEFTPPFVKYLEGNLGKDEELAGDKLSKETVLPLEVSDVKLLNSDYRNLNNSIEVYQFRVTFKINMPEIN